MDIVHEGAADILIGAIPFLSTKADLFDPMISYLYDLVALSGAHS
jgi:hypothetical protein